MKNKLEDLNNHLFAQLERLSDESLEGDELKDEIKRSVAVSSVAKCIIDNGQLVLNAHRYSSERKSLGMSEDIKQLI